MLVPAVAATQVRLVLFIFIRFKAYLDSTFSYYSKSRTKVLEFYIGGKCQNY